MAFSWRQTAAAKCQSTDENTLRWETKLGGGGHKGSLSTLSIVLGILIYCQLQLSDGCRSLTGLVLSEPDRIFGCQEVNVLEHKRY